MTRLNQIIAIEKGTKTRTQREVTDLHHMLQKQTLLTGISRTYQPDDEVNGEHFPAEMTKVQLRARDGIERFVQSVAELYDVTVVKDQTNCVAKASVVVDDKTILKDVPITTLLFLEKQLVDVHTLVKKLPVLDPSEEWHFDSATNTFATTPTQTVKTKKVPQNHIKAPATDKHPAQVEMWYEDKVVGKWKTVKFSGALPQSEISEMLNRVEKLQKAVKFAREEANNTNVTERKISSEIFSYLFGVKN